MNDYVLRNYYSKGKVEINVILCNYCNLNCSSCMFGTNTKEIPRLVYDLEQYKKDIVYLSRFKDIIRHFTFLGGEPTILKNLLTYIEITKEAFPKAKLEVITNGIKLVKDNILLKKLSQLNVSLLFSYYTETASIIKALVQKCNIFKISYWFLEGPHTPRIKNVWSAPLTYKKPVRDGDLTDFRFKCKYGCLLIWNGYFMACGIQFSIPMRNKLFGTNYKEEKGIPIESITNKEDLIELQGSKYIPEICKYCQPGSNEIKFIKHTLNNIRKEDYIL